MVDDFLIGLAELVVAADGDHGGEVEYLSDAGVALFAESASPVNAGAGLVMFGGHACERGELAGEGEAA